MLNPDEITTCLNQQKFIPTPIVSIKEAIFHFPSETLLHKMIGLECQLHFPTEKIHRDFTSMRYDHSSEGAVPTETHHQCF